MDFKFLKNQKFILLVIFVRLFWILSSIKNFIVKNLVFLCKNIKKLDSNIDYLVYYINLYLNKGYTNLNTLYTIISIGNISIFSTKILQLILWISNFIIWIKVLNYIINNKNLKKNKLAYYFIKYLIVFLLILNVIIIFKFIIEITISLTKIISEEIKKYSKNILNYIKNLSNNSPNPEPNDPRPPQFHEFYKQLKKKQENLEKEKCTYKTKEGEKKIKMEERPAFSISDQLENIKKEYQAYDNQEKKFQGIIDNINKKEEKFFPDESKSLYKDYVEVVRVLKKNLEDVEKELKKLLNKKKD